MSLQELKAKSFEEKDRDNLVRLLNLIHSKIANLDGKEAFEYRDLMAWAQQVLLVKVNQGIMGDFKVHSLPEEESKPLKKQSPKNKKVSK